MAVNLAVCRHRGKELVDSREVYVAVVLDHDALLHGVARSVHLEVLVGDALDGGVGQVHVGAKAEAEDELQADAAAVLLNVVLYVVVVIYLLLDVQGNLARARYRGLALGSAPVRFPAAPRCQ